MYLSDAKKGTDSSPEVQYLSLDCINVIFVPWGTVMYPFRTPISDCVEKVITETRDPEVSVGQP